MATKSPSPLPGTASVAVHTWGTHTNGGNGLAHALDSYFFGINPGHASIVVTIPADAAGEALIKKYCFDGERKIIPHHRIQQKAWDPAQKKVIEVTVYEIDFSWWPGTLSSWEEDIMDERPGAEYIEGVPNPALFANENNPEGLNPLEQRDYRGELGTRKVFLAPKFIAHFPKLLDEQKELQKPLENLLLKEQTTFSLQEKIKELKLILSKIEPIKPIVVEGGLKTLLDNNLPTWKKDTANSNQLDAKSKPLIKKKIDFIVDELEEQVTRLSGELDDQYDFFIDKFKVMLDQSLVDLKTHLDTLSPEEKKEAIKEKSNRYSPIVWLLFDADELEAKAKQADEFFNHFNKNVRSNELADPNVIAKLNESPFFPSDYASKDFSHMDKSELIRTKKKIAADIKYQKAMYNKTANQLRSDAAELQNTIRHPLLQRSYGRFVTAGKTPDNTITLPVANLTNTSTNDPNSRGMNIEDMLAKMKEIKQQSESGDKEKLFDLTFLNCSDTVGAVLKAGVSPDFQSYFGNKSWGAFGNPQEVLNGAIRYQDIVYRKSNQVPFLDKLKKYIPIDIIAATGGKLLVQFMKPTTTLNERIGIGFALIPIGIAAGIIEAVKSLAHPKKTFLNCRKFINYALNSSNTLKKNARLIKVAILPVGLLAVAIAPLAGIQHAVERGIIAPISRQIAQRKARLDPFVDQKLKDLGMNIKEIKAPKGKLAIKMLEEMLKDKEYENVIPTFSDKTQMKVTRYLTKAKENPKIKDRARILESYNQSVDIIKDRLNTANKTAHTKGVISPSTGPELTTESDIREVPEPKNPRPGEKK